MRGSLVSIQIKDHWSIVGRVISVSKYKFCISDVPEEFGMSVHIGGSSFSLIFMSSIDREEASALIEATMTHACDEIDSIDLREYAFITR